MPNCFSLTRKSKPEEGPVKLVQIDQEMCDHFKVPCHPTQWYAMWYDIIGFKLACGRSWDDIREGFQQMVKEHTEKANQREVEFYFQLIAVLGWLEANFTTNAWVEIGRR